MILFCNNVIKKIHTYSIAAIVTTRIIKCTLSTACEQGCRHLIHMRCGLSSEAYRNPGKHKHLQLLPRYMGKLQSISGQQGYPDHPHSPCNTRQRGGQSFIHAKQERTHRREGAQTQSSLTLVPGTDISYTAVQRGHSGHYHYLSPASTASSCLPGLEPVLLMRTELGFPYKQKAAPTGAGQRSAIPGFCMRPVHRSPRRHQCNHMLTVYSQLSLFPAQPVADVIYRAAK